VADFGDPNACEQAAADCDRAARQLDDSIGRLMALRGSARDAWRGIAGDSLVSALDTRRQSLIQAQGQLHDAAGRLRTAASEIRAAMRRAERARQQRTTTARPPISLDPAV
jgi:uncharacterized protein YukE